MLAVWERERGLGRRLTLACVFLVWVGVGTDARAQSAADGRVEDRSAENVAGQGTPSTPKHEATPPTSGAPADADNVAFDDTVARWNDTLREIGERLERSRVTRIELRRLNESLRDLQESIIAERDRAEAQVGSAQKLLDALGPPPEENEPAESDAVAAERTSIRQDLSNHRSRLKQSWLLLERLKSVLARMVDAQYATLFGLLSDRTVFPLAPGTLIEARRQLGERLVHVRELIDGWWFGRSRVNVAPLLALLALTALGILACRRVRRRRRRWQVQLPADAVPGRGQRLRMTISYIGERAIIPGTTLVIMAAITAWQPILGTDFHLKVSDLLSAGARLVFMLGVVSALLAPRDGRWRSTRFTDEAASGLYRAVRLHVVTTLSVASAIVMLHPTAEVTGNVSEEALASYLRIYPELSSSSGMLVLLAIGATLLNILRPRHWRFIHRRSGTTEAARSSAIEEEGEDRSVEHAHVPAHLDEAGEADPPGSAAKDADWRPPTLFSRTALASGRLALVTGVVAGSLGFLNLGVYIANRMALTVALVGLALMVRSLVATGLHHATANDSTVGRRARGRRVLGELNSSRLAFWLLLAIDAVLMLAGFLILAVLWGMPVAELQRLGDLVLIGVTVGGFTLSPTDAIVAIGAFLLVLAVVRVLRGALASKILTQTGLDVGARDAVTTIVGYVGLVVAALIGLTLLGIDLSRLALIVGALSVGIGFGLQHVVSNFVSGLILLTTRPLKSGDWIVVGQHQGYVKHISVLTTELQTFDNAAVLVPNSSLVSSEVLNWTHKSTVGRVVVDVRVGYDASPEGVRDVLQRCATDNPDVLQSPEPLVLFMGFGASSLDFELSFFIREIDNVLLVSSDVRYQIVSAFQEAGISIPFPQQDVHLRDSRAVSGRTGGTIEPSGSETPDATQGR